MRPIPAPDPEKQLTIKVKTVERLMKEVQYYKDEVKENEMKLAKMKEEQKDEYDIKKFQEVLDESIMMVPDSETRLEKALDDLKQFMDGDSCKELNNEWMDKAQALLHL